MASIRVRYSSGDQDEWELHEAAPLGDLARTMAHTSRRNMISFRVVASEGGPVEFGLVGIRMAEVASWHIDGIDPKVPTALFADILIASNEPPPTPPRIEEIRQR